MFAKPNSVLKFKAGKMVKNGTTVSADARKGEVHIVEGEGFINFQWKPRGERHYESEEDNIMVFPDEAKYFKVDKCTTGRVYVLQFKGQGGSTDREYFIWMQEPSTDKDDEYCETINSYIKNPHRAERQSRRPRAEGASGGAPQNNIALADLESILRNLQPGGDAGAPRQPAAAAAAAAPSGAPKADVQLTDLFERDDVRQVLSGDLSSFEERLSAHFPEGIETSVLEEIRTPQFRQTLDLLQAALSDPAALEELTKAFDLPPCTDASKGGVERFLQSILALHKNKEEKKE